MIYTQDKDNQYISTSTSNGITTNYGNNYVKKTEQTYSSNQMCNRCANYKSGECPGHDKELYAGDQNKYCVYFKDRNYGEEQVKKHYSLEEFVKHYNSI